MQKPTVSVIIPTYNREKTILRAVNSIFVQTMQDFEVIIVDDASTDKTIDILNSHFTDSRLKIVKNIKNLGTSGAKNVGLEHSSGKYIALLDSDDEWLPEKLEKQIQFMESNSRDFPLSFTSVYVHREEQQKALLRHPRKVGTWFESLLLGETFNLGSTLIATKECFNKVGQFSTKLDRFEDRDWTIRYFDHYSDFQFLAMPLTKIHNSGWPETETVQQSIQEIFYLNKERLKQKGGYYFNLFDVGLSFEVFVAHCRSGKKRKAISQIISIILKKPSFISYMAYRFIRKLKQKDIA